MKIGIHSVTFSLYDSSFLDVKCKVSKKMCIVCQIQQVVAGTERNTAVCQIVLEKFENFASTCESPNLFICICCWNYWTQILELVYLVKKREKKNEVSKQFLLPVDGALFLMILKLCLFLCNTMNDLFFTVLIYIFYIPPSQCKIISTVYRVMFPTSLRHCWVKWIPRRRRRLNWRRWFKRWIVCM